jgi:hypothetical protein
VCAVRFVKHNNPQVRIDNSARCGGKEQHIRAGQSRGVGTGAPQLRYFCSLNLTVPHHIIQGKDCVLSPCVLSSFGLALPPTCLVLTVSDARSYFPSTIRRWTRHAARLESKEINTEVLLGNC